LKNKYDILLENIKVTDEMYDRIIGEINEIDFECAPKKVIQLSSFRKYIYVAVCFVILLFGVITMPSIINQIGNPPIQTIPDVTEYNSIGELSQAVGFEVEEISNTQFNLEKTSYVAYGGKIAEIVYSDSNTSLRFRKSKGQEDPSGDYNEYSIVNKISQNNSIVTIKGNDSKFNLAVWEKDGYSYSLQTSEGVTEEQLLVMISDMF
jgi:hypothetical protein